jgi:myosin V
MHAALQGERSFHIFYQMIRGAAKADRELWKLPAASDVSFFKYLDGPNAVTTIDGVDDSADFQEVLPACPFVYLLHVANEVACP